MNLIGFLAFILLSFSIISYGISDTAFATKDPNPALTVSSEFESYPDGGRVTITGNVASYNSTGGNGLTLVVYSPDDSFVRFGQVLPDPDGSFVVKFVAGGPLWKSSGDYSIKFKYGPTNSNITINYLGGDPVDPKDVVTPPPPAVVDPVDPVDVPPPPPPAVVDPVDPVDVPPPPPPAIVDPVVTPPPPQPNCDPDTTVIKDGQCVPKDSVNDRDSGCLIATAAYGTELAPQVQLLREIRDNVLFTTSSGTSFMTGFNTLYYSFAPTVADWERESPVFKETVKTMITPMLSTLSIMSLADEGSEAEVLGLGISVILLNLGMYVAAPALVGFKVHQHIKSRK